MAVRMRFIGSYYDTGLPTEWERRRRQEQAHPQVIRFREVLANGGRLAAGERVRIKLGGDLFGHLTRGLEAGKVFVCAFA